MSICLTDIHTTVQNNKRALRRYRRYAPAFSMHSTLHTQVHRRVHRCHTSTNDHKSLSGLEKTLTGCGAGCRSLRSRLSTATPLPWDCATSAIQLSLHGCPRIRGRWLGCAIAYLPVESREPRICNPRRRTARVTNSRLPTTRPAKDKNGHL
jgi:hypothetical protein